MTTEVVVLITGAKGMADNVLNQHATKWPGEGYTMRLDEWMSLNRKMTTDPRAPKKDKAEWDLLRMKRVKDEAGYWMRGVPAPVVMKKIRHPRKAKDCVFVSESLYNELRDEYSDWWLKATQVKGTAMFQPARGAKFESSNYASHGEVAEYMKALKDFVWDAPKAPLELAAWKEDYERIKQMAQRCDSDYKVYEVFRKKYEDSK